VPSEGLWVILIFMFSRSPSPFDFIRPCNTGCRTQTQLCTLYFVRSGSSGCLTHGGRIFPTAWGSGKWTETTLGSPPRGTMAFAERFTVLSGTLFFLFQFPQVPHFFFLRLYLVTRGATCLLHPLIVKRVEMLLKKKMFSPQEQPFLGKISSDLFPPPLHLISVLFFLARL